MRKRKPRLVEKRKGTVVNRVTGIIHDDYHKGNINAANPANVPIQNGDVVTYFTFISNQAGAQRIVHVIKEKA